MLEVLVAAVIMALAFIFAWHTELLAFALLLWATITHLSPLLWVRNHPWQPLLYFAGYFLIGAVWSVVKWYFQESERAYTHKKLYGDKWREHKTKDIQRFHSSEIQAWIAFWPISTVWTLLDDPIRKLVRRIYNELIHVYDYVTDWVWS